MISIAILAVTFFTVPAENELVQRIDKLQLENGLFLDRTSDRQTVSSAATGLGSFALALAAKRGLVDPEQVARRSEQAFRTTVAANPARNRGWLSHFTDEQGIPKSYSEVSTIDTALFYLGMLRTAQTLGLTELEERIKKQMAEIDVSFVLRDGQFLHGFSWNSSAPEAEPQFIPHRWNDSSEGVILYKLFELQFQFEIRRVDYPLFVYLYPLMFFEDEMYVTLLREAMDFQIREYGHTGVTATDGPKGYTIADRNLISPLLLSAVGSRFPAALETIQKYSLDPSIAAYYIPSGWTNTDDLTIDLGSAYILMTAWSVFSSPKEKILSAPEPEPMEILAQ